MPELPEVETIRRGLEKLITGRGVVSVSFDWAKSFPNSQTDVDAFLTGATISEIRRRAKVLLIDLDTKYTLVIHLKMTGQLVFVGQKQQTRSTKLEARGKSEIRNTKTSDSFESSASNLEFAESKELRFGAGHPNDSLIGELPDKSTRVILTFSDGSKLFFNDQRKFGWMRLMPTVEVPNIDFMKKVGPEPLNDDFTSDVFIQRIRKRANTSIKAALLDQTVLAGIGNIYADESLWGAKIHPASKVADVSDASLKKLHGDIKYVLQLSIEKGGSTDRNYVNSEGRRGSYIDFARVFRREKLPCPRCGTIIEKSKVAGRGTHTCPRCQRQRDNN